MSSGVRVKGLALWVYCPGALRIPEGPYTLPMELGPKKTIPILVLGSVCGTLWEYLLVTVQKAFYARKLPVDSDSLNIYHTPDHT